MGLLRRYLHKAEPFHMSGIPAVNEGHLEESHGVFARYDAPEGTDRDAWLYEQHCAKHGVPVDPAERDAYAAHCAGIRNPYGSSSTA
jgi:hypothetical protein